MRTIEYFYAYTVPFDKDTDPTDCGKIQVEYPVMWNDICDQINNNEDVIVDLGPGYKKFIFSKDDKGVCVCAIYDGASSVIEEKCEEVVNEVGNAIMHLPFGKLSFWLGILGIGAFVLLTVFFPFLSAFGAILGNVSIGLIILWAIDKFALKNIDTPTELKKGNIAYAIFWLGLALVILGSLLAS